MTELLLILLIFAVWRARTIVVIVVERRDRRHMHMPMRGQMHLPHDPDEAMQRLYTADRLAEYASHRN